MCALAVSWSFGQNIYCYYIILVHNNSEIENIEFGLLFHLFWSTIFVWCLALKMCDAFDVWIAKSSISQEPA